jgi:hypothetical protein
MPAVPTESGLRFSRRKENAAFGDKVLGTQNNLGDRRRSTKIRG